MDNLKEIYKDILPSSGFYLDKDKSIIEDNQFCYVLSPQKGSGYFWHYFSENMFSIQKQDFVFSEDFFLECPDPDFLSVQYYTSVCGEEIHPYRQLSPNSLCIHVGARQKKFHAIYHKNVPIRSVSINIQPEFYNYYLHDKFGDEYVDPHNAFKRMTLVRNFPQIITLLNQIKAYDGRGMTAKMFYEGKVLETLVLIMDRARLNMSESRKINISENDKDILMDVADYIDSHYAFKLSLEQLSKIAFMGTTKLKTNFKEYFGCNISDYIIQKRVK